MVVGAHKDWLHSANVLQPFYYIPMSSGKNNDTLTDELVLGVRDRLPRMLEPHFQRPAWSYRPEVFQ